MNYFPKRNMTAIWHDIYSAVRRCMFTNVSYVGYPAQSWRQFEHESSFLDRKLFNFKKEPFSSGMAALPLDMGRRYFTECLPNDPMAREVYNITTGYVLTSADFADYASYRAVDRFFRQWDVSFRVLIPLPSPSEHWFPVLSASSGHSHQEGERMMSSMANGLVDRLMKLNHEMMINHADHFNPFLAHHVFSEKALNVMRLTSEGYSNREVAGHVGLTEDGVKYHLKNMKSLLSARNVAHLIALTKDMRLV